MNKNAIARTAGLMALFFIFLGTTVRAEVAIGAKAGTLGLGAELTVGLSPQVNVRVGANGYNYTDEGAR